MMYKTVIDKFKKENGRIYYHLKCNNCGNIQETVHLTYTERKCKKCIAKNLLGNVYNGSKIIEEILTSNKFEPISYKIKCKCNTIYQVRRDTLRKNVNKGIKIQCLSCSRKELALSNIEDVKENQRFTFFKQYIKNAIERNYIFELSFDEFLNIINKNCYYCNDEKSHHRHRSTKSIENNGIDRLDNSQGYTVENSVPCCSMCNRMKSIYSEESFLKQIEKIYNFKNTIQ